MQDHSGTTAAMRHFYDGRRVMITGGLGFIGWNLADRLWKLGARVVLVDSMIPGHGGNLAHLESLSGRARINISDVRDENGLRLLVRNQSVIFNLAGQVSHIDSMRDPYTDLEINCRAQLSLLEACRHNNAEARVIFAGTRQVYGRPDRLPVDEDHPVRPTDVNGINKTAGEWYHILYNNVYGVRASSLRLTNTYGPGQLLRHNRQGFIGWFIRQVLDAEEITLFGDGEQERDLTFVDDVVDAFLLAGSSPAADGQIFNLGGERISLKALVELLIELAGQGSYRLVPFPEDKKRIDIGSFYADDSRIRRTLGWSWQVGLREGLRRTLEFYRAHRADYLGSDDDEQQDVFSVLAPLAVPRLG
jgi:UDP-glucose 4-epimerase